MQYIGSLHCLVVIVFSVWVSRGVFGAREAAEVCQQFKVAKSNMLL